MMFIQWKRKSFLCPTIFISVQPEWRGWTVISAIKSMVCPGCPTCLTYFKEKYIKVNNLVKKQFLTLDSLDRLDTDA